jgi:hypothetical protein
VLGILLLAMTHEVEVVGHGKPFGGTG